MIHFISTRFHVLARVVGTSPRQTCTRLALVGFLITSGAWAQPGEKNTDIVIGMSTALSGPAADLGKNMKDGILAGLLRANLSGGIRGRQLRLVPVDDGYEPSRTAPNMRRLIEQENVLAVIGNVGTPTAIAAIPIANEQQTLLFAPFTGAGVLRKSPPDRYVINYRASYAEETAAMIDALIKIGKLKPKEIAFFTQRDGYGDAGYVGGITALKRYGLKDEALIKHVRYERNTLAVEDALASLILSDPLPRAVIMVGAYAPCARFITLAQESGLHTLFLNVSFVGSASLANKLGIRTNRVIVTQVVPHPHDSDVHLVQEFHADMKVYDDTIVPNFGSLEGYIAARIFVRAFTKLEHTITRESIIDALEQLGTFDIGLGHSLHLNENEHQASHRIWPTILKNGTFVPFKWQQLTNVLDVRS